MLRPRRIDASLFPDEYRKRLRERPTGWYLVLALGTLLGGLVIAADLLWWGSLWPAAGAAALLLYLGLVQLASWTDRIWRDSRVRVVPYFQAEVPGPETFFAGHALARNWKQLDRLTERAGVLPLSAFGFADALRGEDETWHSARDGLATVTALIEEVHRDPASFREAEALASELERLQVRLAAADERDVRFCFHLRMDAAYTAHELDVRSGKY